MIEVLKKLSPFTKWITGIGLINLLFGVVTRVIPIYFFWESSYVGCFFIVVGIAGHLVTIIKSRKKNKKNTVGIKIGLGVIIFILSTQILMSFIIPNSEAYSTLKKELYKDLPLQSEVGKINSFGFIPIGQISTVEDPIDYSGDAYFKIIVRGSKKYVFISVTMHKNYGAEWKILKMN